MKRAGFEHGFSEQVWEAAKVQAREAIIVVAARKDVIAYSELVQHITSCQLEPHSQQLAHLLGEISTEEHYAGRGMLTVVVVHKSGDFMPGPGFFELAFELGYRIDDREAFWIRELEKVYSIWASTEKPT